MNIWRGFIHNDPRLMTNQVFFSWWMDKQIVVHPHSGTLLGIIKNILPIQAATCIHFICIILSERRQPGCIPMAFWKASTVVTRDRSISGYSSLWVKRQTVQGHKEEFRNGRTPLCLDFGNVQLYVFMQTRKNVHPKE